MLTVASPLKAIRIFNSPVTWAIYKQRATVVDTYKRLLSKAAINFQFGT